MGKITLYTDNGCDLDNNLLDELGVKRFYMSTTINGQTYEDRLNLEPFEFYRLLEEPGVTPTTSQINLAVYLKEFETVLQDQDSQIIYLAFSGGLSGTYQSACLARDMVDPERITVIDSCGASVGQGLIVVKAAQAVAAGQSKAAILAQMEDHVKRMEYIFIVGSLEMLKRGGRVNPAVATLGDLLNIKLILHFVDGKIEPLEKVHGLKKAKKRLLEIMESRGFELEKQTIGINYSQDLEGAWEIKNMIQKQFGIKDFLVSEIGAVIGSHVGAGTYSVFFLHK